MSFRSGALCLVVRDKKILMVRHKRNNKEYFTLPGGGIEKGETPQQAALRELQEECNVSGKIIQKLCEYSFPFGDNVTLHTFFVHIGDQIPKLGKDPEFSKENQILIDMRWMAFDELCERDRAFLLAQGLLGLNQFFDEISNWGDDISYPK